MNLFLTVTTYFIVSLSFFVPFSYSQDKPVQQPKETYIIGNGDVLRIMTWKEPDFSIDQIAVRLDGKISFPLIGDLDAEGKTPVQLKGEIEKQLRNYITEPNVTVMLIDGASKRFYVLGEVLNTGEFPLVKKLTVLQAFALAGGFTEWAAKKEIILYRRVGEEEKVIKIDYRDIIRGKDFSKNVEIRPDDTIIVP